MAYENILENFRFRSKEQLRRLYVGLRFEPTYRDSVNNCFSGEEILLAGLYRFHAKNHLGDAGWQVLFGWRQPRASSAVKIFVDFMHEHWSKLVFDKVKYWSNFYSYFSQCIDRRIFSEIGAIYMLQ